MAKAKKKTISKKVLSKKSSPKKSRPAPKSKPAVKAKSKRPLKKAIQAKSTSSVSSKTSSKTIMPTASSAPARLVDVSRFVTPLDDRLVVQVKGSEKVTAGGLIIPDTVQNVAGHREGVVIAVGRGHRDHKGRLRPMDVKKGDKILFSSRTDYKLNFQDVELLILRETDVMGVLG